MSLATEIAPHAGPAPPGIDADDGPARRLRAGSAACRLQFARPGVQKALTPEQRAAAVSPFDADAPALAAGKKIFDTRHPAYHAVTAVRTRIIDRWRAASLPYPEPGLRLIRAATTSPPSTAAHCARPPRGRTGGSSVTRPARPRGWESMPR